MARLMVSIRGGEVVLEFEELKLGNIVHGYPFDSEIVLSNSEAGIVIRLSHGEAKKLHESLGKLIESHEKMIKEAMW